MTAGASSCFLSHGSCTLASSRYPFVCLPQPRSRIRRQGASWLPSRVAPPAAALPFLFSPPILPCRFSATIGCALVEGPGWQQSLQPLAGWQACRLARQPAWPRRAECLCSRGQGAPPCPLSIPCLFPVFAKCARGPRSSPTGWPSAASAWDAGC